jgi:hypothetical protein
LDQEAELIAPTSAPVQSQGGGGCAAGSIQDTLQNGRALVIAIVSSPNRHFSCERAGRRTRLLSGPAGSSRVSERRHCVAQTMQLIDQVQNNANAFPIDAKLRSQVEN